MIVVDDGIATGGTARAALRIARAHGARRVDARGSGGGTRHRARAGRRRRCDRRGGDAEPVPRDRRVVRAVQPDDGRRGPGVARRRGRGGRRDRDDPIDTARSDERALRRRGDDRNRRDPAPGPPHGPASVLGVSCCSRTAAGAAGTARATSSWRVTFRRPGSQRCCSTCSRPTRRSIAPTCSTSSCSPSGSSRRRGGLGTSRRAPDSALGYFGASTGAAAALWAAAEDPSIRAVVSRGGRPDLAAPRLGAVRRPHAADRRRRRHRRARTQRGGRDAAVAASTGSRSCRGATHLFEEPGALEVVAGRAQAWFLRYLSPLPAEAGRLRATQ